MSDCSVSGLLALYAVKHHAIGRLFHPIIPLSSIPAAAMSAVEVKQLPGKGRGLVTTRTIEAGSIVLSEEPLLLTVSQEAKDYACANCMCWLERCPGAGACQSCRQVSFCSAACQQQAAAKPWVHAEATCRAYAAIPSLLPADHEAQTNLRFLIQAAAMKAAAAANGGISQHQLSVYSSLMSLSGDPTAASLRQAAVLQPALCQAIGDSSSSLLQQQEVAALLVKEQINSYGLLAPIRHQQMATKHTCSTSSSSADHQTASRTLRGGALYPTCALINHECLPNVARFDALDAAVEGNWPAQWPGRGGIPADAGMNAVTGSSAGAMPSSSSSGCSTTRVVLRALHELPAGTEIVQSYFPLNWDYETRQAQAQQVYGFTCYCPRCVLESSSEWQADDDSSSEGEWETDSETDAATQEDTIDQHMHELDDAHQQQQEVAGSSSSLDPPQQHLQQPESIDPAYLSIFILKYMCPQEGCFGVMAAVAGAEMCECSVCGFTRTDEQFLAGLEQ